MSLPRTNWALFGDRTLSCSRFQGYAIHDYLQRIGQPSRLLSAPPFPIKDAPWDGPAVNRVARLVDGEIVVVERLDGPRSEELVHALLGRGTPVVYAASDWEPENMLPFLCTAVVCSSRRLAEHWQASGKPAVHINEPADFWAPPTEVAREAGDRVRLCWVGHRKNWPTLEPLRALLGRPELGGFELVTVSNHADADVQWSLASAERELVACDVAVIPTRSDEAADYASANRAVQAMAVARPVVAGHIPAYDDLIDQGVDGFLCEAPEEWQAALTALRDPATASEVGARGYQKVRPRFHIDVTGPDWTGLLGSLPVGPRPSTRRARVRLASSVRATAHASYARTALERRLELETVVGSTATALGQLPLAPATAAAAARDLLPPIAGRLTTGLRRRIGARLTR